MVHANSSLVKKKQILNVFFHRDVMGSNPSAVNVTVLVDLKTANTQLVKSVPKFRFWKKISADWKRAFKNFRVRRHQPLQP